MTRLRRYRPTPSMVVACVALAVAMAGTGYAAVAVPFNSVGTLQLRKNSVTADKLRRDSVTRAKLRKNSVTSGKVRNHTLLRVDFKPGQLIPGPVGPRGATGPAGAAGPVGPAGPSARWALVRRDGSIVAQSGGISPTAKPAAGIYILDFGASLAGKLLMVSSANAGDTTDRGTVSVGMCGGSPEGGTCPTGNDLNHLRVITRNKGDNSAGDHPFYIAVVG
jgi:hypothetical protein